MAAVLVGKNYHLSLFWELNLIIMQNCIVLASIKNAIVLFVCPSKILHKYGFQFLLGPLKVPRENKNNAYANFWRHKQRVLWYFWCWLIDHFRYIKIQHDIEA